MSPTSTARHRLTARKIAICAAALVVAVLPTACGAAYADDDSPEVVKVGDASNNGKSGDERGDDDGRDGDGRDGDGDGASDEDAGSDRNKADNADTEGGNGNNNANDKGNGNKNGKGNGGGDNNGNGGGNGGDGDDNGLDVLGTDCSNSDLQPHDGFQEAPRCVDTAFGEVSAAEKNPSLLITEAPDTVQADEEFTITVSTRNLVRDRFLGAADGGYYKEASFLNEEGLQRGHFHTACRMLDDTSAAPNPGPDPEFFLATEDNGGGAAPDEVKVTVDGLPSGTAQCAVWAGDGSHRTPMMQRANQIPAFDSVRITVE